MKKLGKKGFTLVELLAVIVVLTIIMIVAVQQVNRTIRRTRANGMISTIKLAAKGVKTKMADDSMEACSGTDCLKDVIDYDDSKYSVSVSADGDNWVITLTAKAGGEFAAADFNELKYKQKEDVTVVTAKKTTSAGSTSYPEITCKVNGETGVIIKPPTTTAAAH